MPINIASAIEQKKKKISNDDSPRQNNWSAFAVSTFNNLITTIVLGLIGANFIFFTTFADLNKFFTTERFPNYFPNAEYVKPKQTGGMCSNEKINKDDLSFNYDTLEKIGIGKNGGWPYSLAKDSKSKDLSKPQHLYQKFKNWSLYSLCDTFILNKNILKKWLGLFNPTKKYLSNQTFQMLLVSHITLFLGLFLSVFLGFVGFLYNSFESNWIFAIIGLLFGYTFFFAALTSAVNLIKFIGVFLLVPLISNIELIGNILKCNSNALALLFGALTVSSAYSTLDYYISTSMMIVYILLILRKLY